MPTLPQWLTTDQAADLLQVPPRMISAWIKLGAIKHFRIGKTVRIHPQDLQQFCDSFTREASPEAKPMRVARIIKPNFGAGMDYQTDASSDAPSSTGP